MTDSVESDKKESKVLVVSICIFGAVVFLAVGFQVLGAMNCGGEKARRINCAGNLKQIGLALIIYAADDEANGFFPDGNDFQRLDQNHYLTNGKVFSCPTTETPSTFASTSNYRYVGAGLQDSNQEATRVILAHDRLGNHSQWVNCLYLDGHVKGVKTEATTWGEFCGERKSAGDIIGSVEREEESR